MHWKGRALEDLCVQGAHCVQHHCIVMCHRCSLRRPTTCPLITSNLRAAAKCGLLLAAYGEKGQKKSDLARTMRASPFNYAGANAQGCFAAIKRVVEEYKKDMVRKSLSGMIGFA